MKYSKNQHGVLPAVPGTPRLRGVGMIRRLLLAIHIRCLEATADGRTQVLALVADPALGLTCPAAVAAEYQNAQKD